MTEKNFKLAKNLFNFVTFKELKKKPSFLEICSSDV